jgi:predicted phosphoribosyltransferase
VKLLRGDPPFPDLTRRSTILVDDGLASGFTLMVAIETLRHRKANEIVVAVPTAQAESAARIAPLVEALYCPNVRTDTSFAVADAYREWNDVAEESVVALLTDSARR